LLCKHFLLAIIRFCSRDLVFSKNWICLKNLMTPRGGLLKGGITWWTTLYIYSYNMTYMLIIWCYAYINLEDICFRTLLGYSHWYPNIWYPNLYRTKIPEKVNWKFLEGLGGMGAERIVTSVCLSVRPAWNSNF